MATVPAAVPSDRVNLRLLLVSGSSHCFLFSPDDCAQEITDFTGRKPNGQPPTFCASSIRAGFLHRSVTLAALRLPPGGTTVMHLVARDSAPEPRADDERRRAKGGICCCCCNGCCCVL
uniref:Rad60-SLD_2 domain-containing protein n=1 Tax=Macrostomum lignano TaxID=282301 RepID=A0A1I8INE6_9PLAT